MANVYNSDLDAFELYHKHTIETRKTPGATALPALGHALAGSAGTAISNLALYPLDLIVTRLQVQRSLRSSVTDPEEGEYKGVVDAFDRIYHQEGGIAALYSGVFHDTGKSIADSFLFFLFYNYMREGRLRRHGKAASTLPALDELLVGAAAGACSKFFTAPISNIVTRKQTAKMLSSRAHSTAAEPTVQDIVNSIRTEKGIQGFWSGYSAQLVLTLNPGITFFLFETFKRVLLPRDRREDPGARLTFLLAATSKAIASTITYPFSMAKARAQSSAKPPVDPSSANSIKSSASSAAQEKDKAKAQQAGGEAKRLAKRSTVFSTILKIYREEGATALYEGVWGEILKGFFSHGTTMLIKEAVHKLIIQVYLTLIQVRNKAAAKIPSSEEISQKAREFSDQAQEVVEEAYKSTVEKAGTVYTSSLETATKGIQSLSSPVLDSELVKDVGERGQVIAENLTEVAKTGTNLAIGKLGLEGSEKKVGEVAGQLRDGAKSGIGAVVGKLGLDGKVEG